MISKIIQFAHSNFYSLLQQIKKKFPSWKIQDMGSSKKDKNTYHYHISSKNLKEKGILELTFSKDKPDQLTLKIADNRKTIWSINAMKQFISFLKEQ